MQTFVHQQNLAISQVDRSPSSCSSSKLFLRKRISQNVLSNHRLAHRVQTQAAAQIVKVTAEELQKELSERTQPLVIDFYATWCGPCLLLAKELEKVAEEVGDSIKILKVDTDENLELSNQLRIEGLPTMVFVGTSAQKPAIRIEGLYPAQTIVKIIKEDLFDTEEPTQATPAASS